MYLILSLSNITREQKKFLKYYFSLHLSLAVSVDNIQSDIINIFVLKIHVYHLAGPDG